METTLNPDPSDEALELVAKGVVDHHGLKAEYGVARSYAYKKMAEGDPDLSQVIRRGRRVFWPRVAVERHLARLAEESTQAGR